MRMRLEADALFWSYLSPAQGSGFSTVFSTPAFQQTAVADYLSKLGDKESGNFNKQGRGYPDVAAQGAHIPIFYFGDLYSAGGTSSSCPIVASIITAANSLLADAGKGTVGWAHPLIYKEENRKMLRDVTVGLSGQCFDYEGKEHTLPALPGWDAVTGWGSLNQSMCEYRGHVQRMCWTISGADVRSYLSCHPSRSQRIRHRSRWEEG